MQTDVDSISQNNFDYVIVDTDITHFQPEIKSEEYPLVSFIIPTKNSSRTLFRCLKSIQEQTYPNIEIIIVDNGSEDETVAIAQQFTERILFEDGLLGRVRQKGIDHAKGTFLGIFDSDVYFPHSDWLRNALQYFEYDPAIATVWPKNISPPNGTLFLKMYLNLGNQILEDRIRNHRSVVGGGCAIIRKDAVLSIGGYDPGIHWGEDFNLANKLRNSGYKLVYIHDSIYHDTDMGSSIKIFIRKQFRSASTFSANDFQGMGLSTKDIVYENIIIGTKGMFSGLIRDKDISWILFPYFLSIRFLIFGSMILKKMVTPTSDKHEGLP